MPIPGETREPEEGLEALMLEGRQGTATLAAVLAAIAEAPLVLASGSAGPLVLTSQAGYPMIAAFTASDRLAPFSGQVATAHTMSGRQILTSLSGGAGLVINPGSGLGMEIPPGDLPGIVAALPPAPAEPLPAIAVERAIRDARLGAVSHDGVMQRLRPSRLHIATSVAPESLLSEVKPLVFDINGRGHVAVFTRSDYATPYRDTASFGLVTELAEFVKVLTPDASIVINPGLEWAYLLSPDDLQSLRG